MKCAPSEPCGRGRSSESNGGPSPALGRPSRSLLSGRQPRREAACRGRLSGRRSTGCQMVTCFGLVLAVATDFVAGPEEADVEVVTGVDVVLSTVVDGDHDVVTGTAELDVVVVATVNGVVAAVADHGVLTVATEQVVVAGVATDHVVPVATVDVVVTSRAADHVVAVTGVDDVVPVGTDDVVVVVRAVDERRAVLAGSVEPGVAGRTAVTESADGVGRATVEQSQADEEAGGGGGEGQATHLVSVHLVVCLL